MYGQVTDKPFVTIKVGSSGYLTGQQGSLSSKLLTEYFTHKSTKKFATRFLTNEAFHSLVNSFDDTFSQDPWFSPSGTTGAATGDWGWSRRGASY